jgi:glycosyltransferase involved in cell wall biosynthesis
MQILFLKPVLGIGGETKWVLQVCYDMARRNHETSLMFFKSNITGEACSDFIGFLKIIKADSIKLPIGNPIPADISKVRMLLNRYDIVYIHFAPPNDLLVSLIKVGLKVPIVMGFHCFLRSDTLLQKLYLPILKKSLKAFNAYHVLNRTTYIWLRKMGSKNVFHIPNGIDTRTFQLCNSPSSSQLFNILFAGRLVEEKGVDCLIEIIRYVNEKLKLQDIIFTIAGSGPLEDKVKAIAQKYKNVNYLGFVHPKLLPNVYKNAHLFLIPSKTEGMPLSLLEAQACGLPAIGSNIDGISDVIVNGKTGRLIHPRNIAAFAEAIKEYYLLWRHFPDQYYEMNRTIREYIVNNYDWNVIIEKIENMFKEILVNAT